MTNISIANDLINYIQTLRFVCLRIRIKALFMFKSASTGTHTQTNNIYVDGLSLQRRDCLIPVL